MSAPGEGRAQGLDSGQGVGNAKGAGPRVGGARRGPADPVRVLMHRHKKLCERAADPLEIAAGLEAHGVTDRTAARFRHRDVFSLAEELYARVPRAEGTARADGRDTEGGGHRVRRRGVRVVPHLLPGALCAATAAALILPRPSSPLMLPAIGASGVLLIALALWWCLRDGPLRARQSGGAAAALWAGWLLAITLGGDWLTAQLITGGPGAPAATDGPLPAWLRVSAASAVALALAVLPAAGCAQWFAARARRSLAASRGLEDFAVRVRPLLAAATGLFVCALGGLLLVSQVALGQGGLWPVAAALACGALLFTARLLAVHGFPEAAVAGTAAAGALEGLALASLLVARLPGLAPVARPVEAVATTLGPAALPAVACATSALALLLYGLRVLTGASAHAPAAQGGAP